MAAPFSILPDTDTVTGPAERNLVARQQAADEVANQTVGVFDPRDDSVVQVSPDKAARLAELGYTVGDQAAETKAIYSTPGAKLDVLAHSVANTVTAGLYDTGARAAGATDYLKTEHDMAAENPKTALAGTVIGGFASAPIRGLNAVGLGLAAYEGAFNAYNEAAIVDEPITAERVLSGASWGLLYNVVGNVGAYGAAKVIGAGARGVRGANDAIGLFKRAGSEVAAATEAVPKAGFSEFINPGEAAAGESTLQYPEKLELAPDDGIPGYSRIGYNRPSGPLTSPETTPVPKEKAPGPENVATKMAKTLDKKKADALTRQFHENEKALNQKRVQLDSVKEGSKAEKKLLDQIEKHETLSKKYADELDGIKQDSARKEPSKPEEVEDHLFDYGSTEHTKGKVGMWRRSLHALMSEEGLKHDALFKSLGKRAAAAQQAGDAELAAQLFEQKELVGKQLDNMHPDFVDPKTGKVLPGYRSHMREYGRLMGNDVSLAPDLKYREMTPVEKEALHREIATNPEAFPIDKEGLPEVKPTEKTLIQAGAEANSPENAVKEPRMTPKAPPRYSLKGDAPSGGEPGQVIDRDGKSLEEHAAETKATMKPKLGDYERAVKRGTFWRAHWISPGPLKHVVHAGAVLNEIGPFVLNHVDPFVEAVNRIARASESNLGRALKAAVTATASHATSADYVDHNKLWKQNQQLITQLKANPQALTDGLNSLLGPSAADHPKFVGQLVQGAAAATTAVSNQLPRNPQPPTPRDGEFNPPQSVKRRFNRLMRATMDPADVVRNPDPETWAIVQQVHPETAKYVQKYMMGVVTNPKIHLNRQQARRISILLGAPVTPANAPEFLKSMHDSATIMAAPNPPQPGGGSNGPKSAKTGQQVLSLTATPEQNHQLGL